ncbi:DUF362 domain-containing protein [Planctomycetota bacterium]
MKNILDSTEVAVSTGHDGYPSASPYSPSTAYPEYPFRSDTLTKEINHAYEGVRDALRLLGLDKEHYGQKEWNPLGEIVQPGDTVVLKPNFVRDCRETQEGHEDCLITHGSIIRAALEYVYIAFKGEGKIIIADAPQNDADFDVIRRIAGLDEIQAFYRRHAGFDVEVYDLRPEKAHKVNGVICGHERLPGDPVGYVKVDLGRHSMFCEVEHLCHLLYGSEYDTSELQHHHNGGVHEYLVCKTILDADCIINLPKLKTHKKAGITVCMKNLVGINGNKNWLPHHRLGTPAQGGDQFADDRMKHRVERRFMACFRRVFPMLGPVRTMLAKPLKAVGQAVFGDTNTDTIRSGNWYGNDTTWRMAIDLNRILIHFDADGCRVDNPCRRMLCLVDAIVGGEGNGPVDPTPKTVRTIVAGMNPVAVELACARLMGFDYTRIPLLYHALEKNHSLTMTAFGYEDLECRSNVSEFNRPLHKFEQPHQSFKPHFGWQGHIE